jgi:hypothetical protein
VYACVCRRENNLNQNKAERDKRGKKRKESTSAAAEEEEFFNCQTREEINKEKASSISKEFILAGVIPFTLLLAAERSQQRQCAPFSPFLSLSIIYLVPPTRHW